jgi:hypothetical protein
MDISSKRPKFERRFFAALGLIVFTASTATLRATRQLFRSHRFRGVTPIGSMSRRRHSTLKPAIWMKNNHINSKGGQTNE